jgi:hypothetical protein
MIQVDTEEILPSPAVLLRRSKRYRSGNGQKMAAAVEEALGIAEPLIRPVAIWALKPFSPESGKDLPVLPHSVISKITLQIGVVCTIGKDLETRSQYYFKTDRFILGYWLDQIGTYSVSLLTQQVASQLCIEHGAVRWAPGDQAGEPFSDNQQALFDWVPAGRIGVHLTGQKVMDPVKSLSYNLYAGPELRGVECLVSCNHCVWNGACDRQRQ